MKKCKEIFFDTSIEEQESLINMDYSKKEVYVYTSRKMVYERILKRAGTPAKIIITDNKISGAIWCIPFKDKKRITAILSRPILIGNMK